MTDTDDVERRKAVDPLSIWYERAKAAELKVKILEADNAALRELLTALKYGIAQQFDKKQVSNYGYTEQWVYGTDIEKMIEDTERAALLAGKESVK